MAARDRCAAGTRLPSLPYRYHQQRLFDGDVDGNIVVVEGVAKAAGCSPHRARRPEYTVGYAENRASFIVPMGQQDDKGLAASP